jgi:NAD(P)-dependent dehydrogenase (short-subunit alcohol dehydrogenase family)
MTESLLRAPPALTAPKARGLFASLNPPLRAWTGLRVWVVGASSGIGEALAHDLHLRGAQVIVSARNAGALDAFTSAHPGCTALPLDVQDAAAVHAAGQQVAQGGPLDLVVYCAGRYKPMRADAWSLADMREHLDVNYVGALLVLDSVLPVLLAQGSGHVALLGSVAGYRALPRSLAYGPTKAALMLLAETLWMDLRDHGIGVSIVNPGFVRTPLTAQNDFHMPALLTPAQASAAILDGWARGRFEIHFPKRFTLVLKALRLLPFGAYQFVVRRFTGL